jgi:hypothetical protein
MKIILLALLMLVGIVSGKPQQPPTVFIVTTFTEVPKDMEGCGENLFLNKQDEKAERFVFYTDNVRGLICVNKKMILITHNDKSHNKDSSVFSNKDYTLVIKYGEKKTTGDENYQIKSATITLKYHSTVVWTKSVIGGGGC